MARRLGPVGAARPLRDSRSSRSGRVRAHGARRAWASRPRCTRAARARFRAGLRCPDSRSGPRDTPRTPARSHASPPAASCWSPAEGSSWRDRRRGSSRGAPARSRARSSRPARSTRPARASASRCARAAAPRRRRGRETSFGRRSRCVRRSLRRVGCLRARDPATSSGRASRASLGRYHTRRGGFRRARAVLPTARPRSTRVSRPPTNSQGRSPPFDVPLYRYSSKTKYHASGLQAFHSRRATNRYCSAFGTQRTR